MTDGIKKTKGKLSRKKLEIITHPAKTKEDLKKEYAEYSKNNQEKMSSNAWKIIKSNSYFGIRHEQRLKTIK